MTSSTKIIKQSTSLLLLTCTVHKYLVTIQTSSSEHLPSVPFSLLSSPVQHIDGDTSSPLQHCCAQRPSSCDFERNICYEAIPGVSHVQPRRICAWEYSRSSQRPRIEKIWGHISLGVTWTNALQQCADRTSTHGICIRCHNKVAVYLA